MPIRNLEASGSLIPYRLKTHRRARSVRILVRGDRVTVTYPPRVSMKRVVSFVEQNSDWILKYVREWVEKREKYKLPDIHFHSCRARAKKFVKERVGLWNKFYNFNYRVISIRRQRTRWGSCSGAGALNFNYKIMFLPPEIADYIIVHELCHLKEMNHSERFWFLVAKTVPDYRARVRELKKFNCG